MKHPIYQAIARRYEAIQNCVKDGNTEWQGKHAEAIKRLVDNFMPSGSGIDTGTFFYVDQQKTGRLTFNCSFHHMNEGGMYDGWTDHEIVVRPSLTSQIDITITGRDRNDIKDSLADVYRDALLQEIDSDQA